ncbi:hypothetical protein [uncultured Sphingomonas sp.]|uniref:hypothetical protein n=1 Tax=uncultured Sphingomonas sp. TaxID=158754 RepID=UPI0025F92044|nr:hypothetical protein [uncultured Sphingomonas sp.]
MREAVAGMDPSAPREPLARDLAARVVHHLRDHAAEGSEPALAVIGELQRAVLPSPALALATDPNIDTLAMFVEARTASLRARNGWPRTADQEWQDVNIAFDAVQAKLAARYLKIMRA